jgi:hypothetical protein
MVLERLLGKGFDLGLPLLGDISVLFRVDQGFDWDSVDCDFNFCHKLLTYQGEITTDSRPRRFTQIQADSDLQGKEA